MGLLSISSLVIAIAFAGKVKVPEAGSKSVTPSEAKPSFLPNFSLSKTFTERVIYETTGKGKNRVTTFVLTDTFNAGDKISFLAYVVNADTGLPVDDATVSMSIALNGPESAGSDTLTSGPSDENGVAEAVWSTTKPNKKGNRGSATGTYTATVTNVTANGYTWDEVPVSITITLQ